MRELRLFLQFIEKDFLFKLIFALLVYSLVPLAEIVFFVFLSTLIGNWLVLVLAALVGLPGVLVAQSQTQDALGRLRRKIHDQQYPGPEFADLLGILLSMVFLVTPGFLTDVLGYLLLVPFLRDRLSVVLVRKMDKGLKDFSDFLRLHELERG